MSAPGEGPLHHHTEDCQWFECRWQRELAEFQEGLAQAEVAYLRRVLTNVSKGPMWVNEAEVKAALASTQCSAPLPQGESMVDEGGHCMGCGSYDPTCDHHKALKPGAP